MELREHEGGWACPCCGEVHQGPLTFFGQDHPSSLADVPRRSWLTAAIGRDFRRIKAHGRVRYFVRGHLLVPRSAHPDEPFGWGVWVEVDPDDYTVMRRTMDDPRRVDQPPAPGRLDVDLPYDAPTRGLPAFVHQSPVGQVPTVSVDPTSGHALAKEQANGIDEARVAELNHLLLSDHH